MTGRLVRVSDQSGRAFLTLLVVTTVIGLSLWGLVNTEEIAGAVQTRDFGRLVLRLNDSVARAASSTINGVAKLFGGSAIIGPAAPSAARSAQPPPAPSPEAPRARKPGATASERSGTRGPKTDTGTRASSATATKQRPPQSPAVVDPGAAGPREDAKIYGSDDSDVTAPVALRPAQIMTAPPRGIRPDRLVELELLIATTGAVEKIVMRSPPNPIHDVAIVSAAKTWRFRPAVKDGRPVRYRQIVWVTISD